MQNIEQLVILLLSYMHILEVPVPRYWRIILLINSWRKYFTNKFFRNSRKTHKIRSKHFFLSFVSSDDFALNTHSGFGCVTIHTITYSILSTCFDTVYFIIHSFSRTHAYSHPPTHPPPPTHAHVRPRARARTYTHTPTHTHANKSLLNNFIDIHWNNKNNF